MHIDNDAQPVFQHRVHRRIQLGHEYCIEAIRRRPAQKFIAVDAEPHMVKSHRMHQCNVVGGRVAAQPGRGVIARLRKPHARVHAPMQQLCPPRSHVRS